MPENMSISVNGQSQVPPGFRFHPTEEELLQYYLRKKVSYEKIDLDVIRDVDLNKLEPWDIQEKCKIGTTPQNDWYFFSHKDKKYPTGTRTNRATVAGFWKATGRDKVIYSNGKRIGMRKTLVFYQGRAPHGQKSDWIMHEYRLDDNNTNNTIVSNVMGDGGQEEGWVVCRIFKKKNHLKTLDSPLASSISREGRRSYLFDSCDNEGALEHILQQMGRGMCKEENYEAKNYNYHDNRFMKLPSLETPKSTSMEPVIHMVTENEGSFTIQQDPNMFHHNPLEVSSSMMVGSSGLTNWAALDTLVASQLNGQNDQASRQLACFNDPTLGYSISDHDLQLLTLRSSSNTRSAISPDGGAAFISHTQDYTSEIDLWNFAQSTSSSETICHVSNTLV
ncbi:hypothetical protein TanjilG_11171 [Lupinus angustifolius]|uniref:NAC domain-containing protein n=1 Tax=Lupinus angustifolius TaxID=3871 RepID=A0A1J7HKL0_LUPAN|nr:PREDICTED: NAC domain-containing protein 43-like [Lupinus angustifolius]OIW02277.1 hypothetical protein TanjilG_11171 [Lupinus angustifolius]